MIVKFSSAVADLFSLFYGSTALVGLGLLNLEISRSQSDPP